MLELGKHFVSFEPDNGGSDSVGNVTENFFDTANSKICTMRNNGALGLTAKSLYPNDVISVRTKDRGVSRAVKISPDGKLALLQRTSNSVDVLLLTKNDGSTCIEFPVASKSKEDIMNVEWITSNQILFVTRQCLELFALNVDKRNAKLLKTLNIATTWSQYYARANILTIASGPSSSTLRPVTIRQGTLVRLKEFTVDFGASSSREHLLEKDVTIGTIMRVFIVILIFLVGIVKGAGEELSQQLEHAYKQSGTSDDVRSSQEYSGGGGGGGGGDDSSSWTVALLCANVVLLDVLLFICALFYCMKSLQWRRAAHAVKEEHKLERYVIAARARLGNVDGDGQLLIQHAVID